MNAIPMQTLYAIPRATVIATAGIIATLALLFLMQLLVAVRQVDIDDGPKHRVINPVMDQPEPLENRPNEKIEPPMPPVAAPPAPPQPPVISKNSIAVDPGFTPPIHKKPRIGASGIAIPLVRVAPIYPSSAVMRNIEGYVDLIFDISVTGAVENIRVLDAQPQGYFERAAIAAVAKWKYRPQLLDGEPVAQPGVPTRVKFELDK